MRTLLSSHTSAGLGLRRGLMPELLALQKGAVDFLELAPDNWIGVGGKFGEDLKELMLNDERGVFFTTPHWNGYPAVLMRIPDLARIDREELGDTIAEAWLTRAQKRVARAWLEGQAPAEE